MFIEICIIKKTLYRREQFNIRRRDMAFLALASQKSLLTLQKNFLQLQYTSIMNQISNAQAGMTAVERDYAGQENADYTEDATYIYYEDLDNQLETEKDSIDSQLTAIENEISGLKTLVNNNIKSSCTLNLLNS
jgi:hypothetical protein